LNSLYNWYKQ